MFFCFFMSRRPAGVTRPDTPLPHPTPCRAIEAGSTRIEVVERDGGKSRIAVSDDGCGMTADGRLRAVERNATSKLRQDDLQAIATLGFRGEALPSLGAVSRLAITARARDADSAWRLAVEGGRLEGPVPAATPHGTRVEVRDLFYATPARLQFLPVDRTAPEPLRARFTRP